MVPKKVLIITYYWPPAGGPGVQRWLKFVKYLPQYDIAPVVYIPSNAHYPIVDESLIDEVPEDVTIIKQAIREPYKWAGILSKKKSKTISKGIIPKDKSQSIIDKFLLFIRGNLFIPDARKQWVSPSVQYLSTYIDDFNIETVITTGPPHSLHLIGLKLQALKGIPWIADFRDPWTTIGYHKQLRLTNMAKKKHLELENQVLKKADQLIVTSEVTKREFTQKTNRPITVITNGYDVNKVKQPPLDSKFSMAHIGSLLSERNPENLWLVLKELIDENTDFAADFELIFVGSVSDEVLKSIESYGISSYVSNIGYVSHNESIVYQKKSQVLVLVEIDNDDTKCIIPGKLFEYMVSNRPIVALGPKGSDVEGILRETNTGQYFYYDAHQALKDVIYKHYLSYKEGKLQSYGIGLQKYSRETLTKTLAELL
ncbi:glycosyl transferase family 1 [Hanstruepera neustonica]|uniref:Glycosyl transferase family 1 n=1 Tax=Hanstruepera neustonica TaxID=1445657 RepID=A0A2K1DY26_9FLAO|nr:glycosyltransferase [Hanstruepera neustonica]PNQ72935.1 glycosyl transferase family 1 [Hanstruepera neustonica]